MRAWLDELDKKYPLPEPKPTMTVAKPRMKKWFEGINPYFDEIDADPEEFGWDFTGKNIKSNVAYFESYDEVDIIKMNYYYTTGTVQLVYKSPGWDDFLNIYGYPPPGLPRRVQETYRGLDDEEFIDLLDTPTAWYGRGTI